MHAAEMVSLVGFLLTDEEWQDEELRQAVLEALAERATQAADQDSYESYELLIDAA